jgi:glycosidase
VVWLNPVYESPQVDGGYDISDYRAIDDRYRWPTGTRSGTPSTPAGCGS